MRQRYSPKVRHHGGSVDAEPVRECLNGRPALATSHQLGDVTLAESAQGLPGPVSW
jgi:hypothetical protein